MNKVRQSIGELGDRPMQKLAYLSSKERLKLFKKNLSDDSAKILNDEFEKSITSQKISALESWVKRNLDEKYRADFDANKLNKKIKNIDEFNDYIEANAENFALQKNKVVLSAKEVKKFNELGKRLLEARKKLGDNFGDIVDNFNGNLKYAQKLKEIQEYSQSLIPSSRIKTFTKSIGKAVMLASIKSPLLNIISNTFMGFSEAVSRRIANKAIGGKVDGIVLKSYIKGINKIFKETGIDMSRMITVDEPIAGVGKVLGEEISTPKGKYTRAFTDFIFNKTLSTPDVAFSSVHFADSANIVSSKYARGNSVRANEIFKDAIRIEPRTTEGQVVRNQAIADSMYATFTNNSANARLNMKIRDVLGPVGDIMMPFVKTPANVIESGLDYSGLGALKGVYKMQKAIRADGFKGVSREAWREIGKDVTRAGLGLTGAYILAGTISTDEFIGAYDPARVKVDQLKNTTYNAVRIGDKWVNVDYFGPLGVPLVGFLYAKKYGGEQGMIKPFLRGMREQFEKSPGIEPLATTIKTLTSKDLEGKAVQSIAEFTTDQLAARLIPGFMYDLSKATDEIQRDTRQKKYMLNIPLVELELDSVAKKIPFLRKTLPAKHDSLGRIMYEDGAFQSLMFGARVRNVREDEIVNEIFRLRDNGQTPNIKDLRFMNSTKVDELIKKVGDEKFYEITREYGQKLADKYANIMRTLSYKNASFEKKKDLLDSAGQDLYVKTLNKYGIKYR